MRIVIVALASLAIGGVGVFAPAGIQSSPLNWISTPAWAQSEEPLSPPLPLKRNEKDAREAAKRRFTEDNWIIFKAPEQLFSVALPEQPKVSAKSVSGHTPLIQHDYQVDPGDGTAYHAIVFEYPEGRAPDTNIDYYRRLVAAYAKGSGSTVAKEGSAVIARRHGYEAVTTDKANDLTHLIDLLPTSDRVYMLVTAGPPGHARSEEARRFRQSFQLIDPDASTGDEVVEQEPTEEELATPEQHLTEETAPATPRATEEDLMGDEADESAPAEGLMSESEEEEIKEPTSRESLYGDGIPETGETTESDADGAPSPDAESMQQGESTPAEEETESAEESTRAEDGAPTEEEVTEPEQTPAPEHETPAETAPVPPRPDDDADTAPAPDSNAVDAMPPAGQDAPENEEEASPKAESETKETGVESTQPDLKEAAPEAGESDGGPTEEEAPETKEAPEASPSPSDEEESDPDEQLSI